MESYTLYLDESGDAGWPAPFGKSRTKWFVLAGVAFKAEDDLNAKLGVEGLLEKYVPKNIREENDDKYYEIHHHDILYGKNIFSHLDRSDRISLIYDVVDLILKNNPILFATVVNKVQHRYKYEDRAFNSKILAMQGTIGRFSMYLDRVNAIGSIVMDSEEYKKDNLIRNMVQKFRKEGVEIRGINYQPRKVNKLEKILNTVNFSPSEMSAGIQLADICSSAIWNHFERNMGEVYALIEKIFDQNEPSVTPMRKDWVE